MYLKCLKKRTLLIISVVCALVSFFWGGLQVRAEEGAPKEEELYAASAVLMDAASGRVLYGKNPEEQLPMASTTKIMTCILILENGGLEDVLTVSPYAAGMPKVKLNMYPGEQYRVKDLLYSLMLESHNDSAAALAEYFGAKYLSEQVMEKSQEGYTETDSRQAVDAFVGLMNQKAAQLGCENTWFITPNGLDAEREYTDGDGNVVKRKHSTTASELAWIMSYCVKKSPARETFLKLTQTKSYQFTANGRVFHCQNHNSFLDMMEGAVSGKTGFTNQAGYCYVGALERDGDIFVVSLLACGWPNHKTWKWSDTRKLMEYGKSNFSYQSFLEPGLAFDEGVLKPVPVLNGQTKELGRQAYVDTGVFREGTENAGLDDLALGGNRENQTGILLGKGEKVTVRYSVTDKLEAPVREGCVVGEICYLVDDVVYRREKIVTTGSVEKIDFKWCLEQILYRFWENCRTG